MTAQIDLLPSPFDRLDPVAKAIRWWTTQMSDIFGRPPRKVVTADELASEKKIAAKHVTIALPDEDAFLAKLELPRGRATAHEKAIKLRLADLSPADPADLRLSATAIREAEDGSVTYAVGMARIGRLRDLEKAGRSKGARTVRFHPEGTPEAELKSQATDRRDRRWLISDGVLAIGLVAVAVAAVAVWTARIEQQTAALTSYERGLRRAVVETETTRRDAEIARDLVSRGILDRRAGAVLTALADLDKATPNGAWWTSIKWSPSEIAISAQATDASHTIESMSHDAKAWVVELAGTINAGASGGPQSFELMLHPREAKPK